MLLYAARRLLMLLPTALVPLSMVFLLLHIAPGDPASVMLGAGAAPEQVARLNAEMGLDRSLMVQFREWAASILTLDLGESLFLHQPVIELVLQKAEVTLLLTSYAMLIAVGVGVLAGVLAALFRNGPVDRTLMGFAIFGVSMPDFWLGLNLILIFSVKLGWFPVAGYIPFTADPWESIQSLTLPAVALGVIQSAFIARITRSSMLDVLNEDYVTSARAKGLRERRVVSRHILRNALIPVLTVIGLSLAVLLSGAVVVESVFGLPGLGRLLLDAVVHRDYPVIQGVVLFIGIVYIVVNLAVDMIYGAIDPRVRYGNDRSA